MRRRAVGQVLDVVTLDDLDARDLEGIEGGAPSSRKAKGWSEITTDAGGLNRC
jgi:hypothetical protein